MNLLQQLAGMLQGHHLQGNNQPQSNPQPAGSQLQVQGFHGGNQLQGSPLPTNAQNTAGSAGLLGHLAQPMLGHAPQHQIPTHLQHAQFEHMAPMAPMPIHGQVDPQMQAQYESMMNDYQAEQDPMHLGQISGQNNLYGPQMQGNYGVHLPQESAITPTLQGNYYHNLQAQQPYAVQSQPWQNIRLQ